MFLARLVTLFGSLALDVPGKRPKGRRGQRWLETLHVNLLDEVASPHQKSAPRHQARQTLMKMMMIVAQTIKTEKSTSVNYPSLWSE